jgi:DNA primase small subunit
VFSDLVLSDQDCFKKDEGWEELLQLIPNKEVAKELRKTWNKFEGRSSEDKWSDLKKEVAQFDKRSKERVRPWHDVT